MSRTTYRHLVVGFDGRTILGDVLVSSKHGELKTRGETAKRRRDVKKNVVVGNQILETARQIPLDKGDPGPLI